MAQVSCDAYRAVVRGDARFIDYFQAATPVSELARMNIGSRPAKRKAAGSIDTLRAIPWIFAWTQTRFHLPVWLGIGAAFQASCRRQCHAPPLRFTCELRQRGISVTCGRWRTCLFRLCQN